MAILDAKDCPDMTTDVYHGRKTTTNLDAKNWNSVMQR